MVFDCSCIMAVMISVKVLVLAFILIALNGYLINGIQANEDSDSRDDNIHVHHEAEHNHYNENVHELQEESSINSLVQDKDQPKFGEQLQNVTVSLGREAVLKCVVDNLQTFKIAWLRVDTQTILTIQNHVITKNHRISITHAEKRAWVLRIKEVKESDKGWYMCQINTDPMKNHVAYLNVVVPPDILDYSTSTDIVAREGNNVTLKCAAAGSPTPYIMWRREGGEPIAMGGTEVTYFNGSMLSIARVNRLHMGPYLCIASNGIPPTVSKRVMLIVHFPPMIWIQNQLVGAAIGQQITLECQSEAFPKSINYWMKNDTIITQDGRFAPETFDNGYKVVMKLTINAVDISDFGSYECVAKNSLGDTDGSIKLYHIPHTTVMSTVAPTQSITTTKIIQTIQQYSVSKDKLTPIKSTVDVMAASANNFIVGATSGLWNGVEGREREVEHQQQEEIEINNEIHDEAKELSSADNTKASLAAISGATMTSPVPPLLSSLLCFVLVNFLS